MEIKDGKLKIYKINKNYLNYLAKNDRNVRQKDNRKYYGIIITNNNRDYCIPFTCKVKKRNKKLTVNILDNDKKEIIAQLTLNNMIPVKSDLVELVDINLDKDRDYLIKELRYLRKENVKDEIINKTDKMLITLANKNNIDYAFFKSLCGDFNKLEKECDNWSEK